jgi:hypothetical protein
MFASLVSQLKGLVLNVNKQFSGPNISASDSVVDASGVNLSEANLIMTVDANRQATDISGRRLAFDFSDTSTVAYDISGQNISWTIDASGGRVFAANTTTFFRDPDGFIGNQTVGCSSDWTGAYESVNTTFINGGSGICQFDCSDGGCPETYRVTNSTISCANYEICKQTAAAAVATAGRVEQGPETCLTNCTISCANYEICKQTAEAAVCHSDACGTGAGCGTDGGCPCKTRNLIAYD